MDALSKIDGLSFVNQEQKAQYLRDKRWVEQNYKKLDNAIEQFVEAGKNLWNYGDGHGGGVLECFFRGIAREGLKIDGGIVRWIAEEAGATLTKDSHPQKLYTKKKISTSLRLRIYKRDGYKCLKCGSEDNLTIDHIHPESKGGVHTEENLQTLCRPCNTRKGVKLVNAMD